MLQIHKPDIWKFIAAIQKQQGLQEFAYAQRMHGKLSGHQQEDNYTRIKRIVCSAQNYNEFEYLKAIALNCLILLYIVLLIYCSVLEMFSTLEYGGF